MVFISRNKFQYFHSIYVFIWLCFFMGTLVFALARLGLLFTYGSENLLTTSVKDLLHSFKIGFLFDLKTLAMLFSPFFIVSFTGFIWRSEKPFAWFEHYLRYIAFILLSVCLFIALINHYYYGNFGTHINIFIFSLFDGQTKAILASVWQDYPVIHLILGLSVFMWLFYKILTRAFSFSQRRRLNPHISIKVVYVLCAFLFYALVFRGSLQHHQLKFAATLFSNNALINQATLNGVASFFYAYKDRKNDVTLVKVENETGRKAYNTFFGTQVTPNNFSFGTLFARTPKNSRLEKHPPNIVFIQMESMGTHFYLLHNKENNMLGRLAPHIKKDLFFTHFLTGGEGTLDALTHFLIYSPFMYVPQSSLQNVQYVSSIAKPFKDAGYKTIFLTSAEAGWHNFAHFLPREFFDTVLGKQAILKMFPHGETEAWGIYDEYVFAYAYDLLKKTDKQGKPVFIYINTISNHSPYTIPSHYKSYSINIPKTLPNRMQQTKEKVKKILLTYQYANDHLGAFLSRIKKSPFAQKVIIGASGDHNQHELIARYSDYREKVLKHSVPFYLYVPKFYMKGKVADDTRVGSHKDIFPTLYHLALSNMRYINLGNDLLTKKPKNLLFGYYRDSFVLLPEGLIITNGKTPFFYPWTDRKKLLVSKPKPLSVQQQTLYKRIKAYGYLLFWQLEKQAYNTLKASHKETL